MRDYEHRRVTPTAKNNNNNNNNNNTIEIYNTL